MNRTATAGLLRAAGIVRRAFTSWKLASAAPVDHLVRRAASRDVIMQDLARWQAILALPVLGARPSAHAFRWLFVYRTEFRNLVYYRLLRDGDAMVKLAVPGVRRLWPPSATLCLESAGSIGAGCFIQHGVCTWLGAKSIGRDFWVGSKVGIGTRDGTDCPTIGDGVRVGVGAIVLGEITLGDGAYVGAGAVVIRDVAPNTTVVGVPARALARRSDASK